MPALMAGNAYRKTDGSGQPASGDNAWAEPKQQARSAGGGGGFGQSAGNGGFENRFDGGGFCGRFGGGGGGSSAERRRQTVVAVDLEKGPIFASAKAG